ncbi:cold-inducible protein YdjO-related protein [Paenibacillus filicis]|uniref:Cold-inducible protein YdjO-related protein n=1 Tax=Paenibacillus gyeongsangnamensis TaxID=3388067 RepID=A0ABT4QIX5_9BACL|nr:cold-inducible protein YdjO-related protein [Paenibacillus filicis]MCZ8516794.1 cold-inducible protein YdjO-related protein [Paenibacillus filicis]
MSTTSMEKTEEILNVWNCKNNDCNAWIRDEFVTEAAPECPMCSEPMVQGTRAIPIKTNKSNRKFIIGKRRF